MGIGQNFISVDGKKYQILFLAESFCEGRKQVVYQELFGEFRFLTESVKDFCEHFQIRDGEIGDMFHTLTRKENEKKQSGWNGSVSKGSHEKSSSDVVPEATDAYMIQENPKAERNDRGKTQEPAPEMKKASLQEKFTKATKASLNNITGDAGIKSEEQGDNKEEQVNEDLIRFLDADSFKEKIELLLSMRDRVDRRLLTNLAVTLDVALEDGTNEEYFDAILSYLRARARFEVRR